MAKKTARNPYYFSERLQARLAEIPDHALTLVEAPAGFGKTTAVREYLAATLPKGAHERWHTCLGESPEKAWAAVCGLFRGVDDAVAEGLSELGVPTRETLPDIAALLRECRCDTPSYLVIDNYQLFAHSVQRTLVAALAACRDERLRLVVITQPLPGDAETAHRETGYYGVCAQDLLFDSAAVAQYCRLAGIALSSEDRERILSTSEGWIAAIRLQLRAFEENGSLLGARGVGALVETAVWNKMSAGEKDFLMGIALLDGFTRRQAAIVGAGLDGPVGSGGPAMPESVAELLSLDFFIRYVADKKVYSIHSVLRDYLLERFEVQAPDAQSVMYRKAAVACRAVGDYFQAARFFFKVGDDDAVLSMPFTDHYFFNNQEQDIFLFFDRFIQECPPDILLRHPLTLVTVGIQFSKKGMREQYDAIAKLLGEFLENPPEMPEKQLCKIKGEYHMLLFFSRFNDIAGMGEHHKKAHGYLKQVADPPRSSIYVGNLPWAMGVPSVISVYWSKSGELRQALTAMDECLPFYADLAGGHGAGGEILMRAEAHFMRGDDVNAERLCHKTLYVSKNAGQTSNCLCAELVLARIGIVRGDQNMYRTARQHIVREMDEARQTALTRLGEMCLADLDMALGDTRALPDWLRSTRAIQRALYAVTQPHAIMLHCKRLLLEKRRAELAALAETAMETARAMHYPLLQSYHLIFLALLDAEEGRKEHAVVRLRDALAVTLSDSVYLPFAEHADALSPLMEECTKEFGDEPMAECLALGRRWMTGRAALSCALPAEPAVLTPRQREVALLIREGLSAKDIAAKLQVAESTVTSTRKAIYLRLNIHSNMELAKIKL